MPQMWVATAVQRVEPLGAAVARLPPYRHTLNLSFLAARLAAACGDTYAQLVQSIASVCCLLCACMCDVCVYVDVVYVLCMCRMRVVCRVATC
jgi:hypothetical protein